MCSCGTSAGCYGQTSLLCTGYKWISKCYATRFWPSCCLQWCHTYPFHLHSTVRCGCSLIWPGIKRCFLSVLVPILWSGLIGGARVDSLQASHHRPLQLQMLTISTINRLRSWATKFPWASRPWYLLKLFQELELALHLLSLHDCAQFLRDFCVMYVLYFLLLQCKNLSRDSSGHNEIYLVPHTCSIIPVFYK